MSTRKVTDQMGRPVEVPQAARRIVSLVPSQTELLYDLGLAAEVVGVTKFCIYPAHARKQATVVGGTKQFNFERIAALQPDLIIGNKEENYKEGILKLAEDYPVWMSDIFNLEDALAMMREVGGLTGKAAEAEAMAGRIEQEFAGMHAAVTDAPRAVYLIWQNPFMAVGHSTFIDQMLPLTGLSNALGNTPRYPELSPEDLQALQPAVILLSSEPYPFQEKHVAAIEALCPKAKVLLVDGERFSWYGSRLLGTAQYLKTLRSQVGL